MTTPTPSGAADAAVGTVAPPPAPRDYMQLLRLLDSQVEQHLNLRSGNAAQRPADAAPAQPGAAAHNREPARAVPAAAMTAPQTVPRHAEPPASPRAAARHLPMKSVVTGVLCGTAVLAIGWAVERAADGAWQSSAPPATTTSHDVPAPPAAAPITGSAAASAPSSMPAGGAADTTCSAAATALALCKPSNR